LYSPEDGPVEAETCSDTVTITTPIKNPLVASAGIVSERLFRARAHFMLQVPIMPRL
jgi:hypothetical protein